MRRTTLNFLVDFAAFLAMLGMIGTGLIVRFALPPGTGGRWTIWDMGRHDWGALHYYLAIALLALLLVHLALHWSWTCVIADKLLASIGLSPAANPAVTNRRRAVRRVAIGCVTLVVVGGAIGGFYWWAASNVVEGHGGMRRGQQANRSTEAGTVAGSEPELAEHGRRGEETRGRGRQQANVRGSMTLAEVAEQAGVSVARLKSSLGLPDEVADDARIGRVRQSYGLSMSQIREAVASLTEIGVGPS